MSKFERANTVVISRTGTGDILSYYKYKLVVAQGPEAGHEFVVDRDRVRIGAAKDNDLILEHATVSRRHIEINVLPEGAIIRDLGSTNGTFLDGSRIREAFLHPGARIGIGEVVVLFQPLQEKVEIPLSATQSFGRMLGCSAKMRAMFHLAERVASKDTTLLITGETGTGKGLLAEEVHAHSPRNKEPFVVLDCATIPSHLMESELFGHVKGAFTGAIQTRIGAFQEANHGTVFLDEVGDLPLPLQPKLLRVVEKREVKKVGTTETSKVNVRIIAATNRDLKADVESGNFREDLFFRLSVFELKIPPLRDRKDDIPFLAQMLLHDLSGDPERRIGEDALRFLASHDWPGNIRELRNVIERVAHLVDAKVIDRHSLLATSSTGVTRIPANRDIEGLGSLPFHRAKEMAEKEYLQELLRKHDNNISAAARTAAIHRQSLHRLLRKHGIRTSEETET